MNEEKGRVEGTIARSGTKNMSRGKEVRDVREEPEVGELEEEEGEKVIGERERDGGAGK